MGHLELADLAQSTGLEDLARKHAEIVIGLKPKEILAREILGHTRHKGKWLTTDEARAAGLIEYKGEWLTARDHAEHEVRQNWAEAWEIDKKKIIIRTNTTRRKLQSYYAAFMQFKRDMERTFGMKLNKKYKVNVYATKDEYHRIGGGPRGTGGFYSPGGRDFHFFDDPDWYQARRVFFHEGTHMFVNLTNRNKAFHYPNWLNEGMAEFFGGARLDYEKKTYSFGHILNDRLEVIQGAVSAGRQQPWRKFITEEGLRGAYDQGWSMVLFLQQQDGGKGAIKFGKFLEYLRSSRVKMRTEDNPDGSGSVRGQETLALFEKLFVGRGKTLEDPREGVGEVRSRTPARARRA